MAASSPSLNNSIADPSAAGVPSPSNINSTKNLRGLNKPKCIKCGNVARSRCPFQSCKSCCAKALNPCHIHVLKGQSNLPDKAPSFGSPAVDPQSTDTSHPGASHRPASFRQLSTNFAQFNNLQTPLKSRKPITRKDAQVINEWRFSKLKEFRDNNIEVENEAFDRYMQNVCLLEEVFGVDSSQDRQLNHDGSSSENPKPNPEGEAMVSRFKLQLKSNPVRIENSRKRMQSIVEKGLQKLRKLESGEATDKEDIPQNPETNNNKSPNAEWTLAMTDLTDRLNKARNEEDLKACWAMKTRLFNRRIEAEKPRESGDCREEASSSSSMEPTPETIGSPLKEIARYSPPKWFSITTIGQEELSELSTQFDSLEEIEEL
ncbi:hypothetical protein DM860_011830 [Cuscuta australis]|uniref:Uncharacterized protein n=1 Tax=Cuscuta australis TaxID=267555 RepID=A0A328DKG3_9ASTE|nr:hypothetical protein DM860_011830 [Cuscuta australis]